MVDKERYHVQNFNQNIFYIKKLSIKTKQSEKQSGYFDNQIENNETNITRPHCLFCGFRNKIPFLILWFFCLLQPKSKIFKYLSLGSSNPHPLNFAPIQCTPGHRNESFFFFQIFKDRYKKAALELVSSCEKFQLCVDFPNSFYFVLKKKFFEGKQESIIKN